MDLRLFDRYAATRRNVTAERSRVLVCRGIYAYIQIWDNGVSGEPNSCRVRYSIAKLAPIRFGYQAMSYCDRNQLAALIGPADTIRQAGRDNKHLSVGDTWSLVIQYYGRLYESLRHRLESMNASVDGTVGMDRIDITASRFVVGSQVGTDGS